jgi:hypothetical protein
MVGKGDPYFAKIVVIERDRGRLNHKPSRPGSVCNVSGSATAFMMPDWVASHEFG